MTSSSRDHAPSITAVTSGQSHTPGPWRLSLPDETLVVDASGNAIANTSGDYEDDETWPFMAANAQLIAAAPDLLAALKQARGVLAMMTDPKSIKATSVEYAWAQAMAAEAKARAAIAKAEGR